LTFLQERSFHLASLPVSFVTVIPPLPNQLKMRLNGLTSRSAVLLILTACLLNLSPTAWVLADPASAPDSNATSSTTQTDAGDTTTPDAPADAVAAVTKKEAGTLTTAPEEPSGPPPPKTISTSGLSNGSGFSNSSARKSSAATANKTATAGKVLTGKVLQGSVTEDGKNSPFISGAVQTIPKSTTVELTICGNLNSEVSQKGDEVLVQIGHDVNGTKGVSVPGGWYAHGLVTDAASQKRMGRDGYVVVEFDKLVSPDGQYEVPFHASFSTKDKLLKSVAKTVAIDTGYVSYGALGGALLSLQVTGIPMAIATHGYSVAVGAGVGATLGAIGAIKRKGKVASLYPGDMMKLITAEPITLPGFNKAMLPSGQVHKNLQDMAITINKASFSRDPNGDKESSLLTVDLTMANKTEKEYTFFDLAVVSDRNQRYLPSIFGGFQQLQKKVKPNCKQEGVVTFEVEGKKRKYWLVLLDRTKDSELSRVPIN